MSENGLSKNDLISVFNNLLGNQVQNKEQLEQIKPMTETLLPLVFDLLQKTNPASINAPLISDLALKLKNVIEQQSLSQKELKKIERGIKKALEKDGIKGVLEYLSNKLQAEEEPNDQ